MTSHTGDPDGPGGDYCTIAHWYDADMTTITETHPTLAEAEHSGQHWGCLTGIRRVEVRSPDGTLQALWDKEDTHVTLTPWHIDNDTGDVYWERSRRSSRWQRLGGESIALGRRAFAEATAEPRAAGKLRNPPHDPVQ